MLAFFLRKKDYNDRRTIGRNLDDEFKINEIFQEELTSLNHRAIVNLSFQPGKDGYHYEEN